MPKDFQRFPTCISSHLISFSTSVWLSSMNSSCWTTSGKCFWEKSSAACIKSRQLWVSAKSRIPRQLEGSSWLSRKSQQALFTPEKNNDTFVYINMYHSNSAKSWQAQVSSQIPLQIWKRCYVCVTYYTHSDTSWYHCDISTYFSNQGTEGVCMLTFEL